MTVEEKIKQLTDANKEWKRLVSEQNLRIQDWITEIRHAHGLLESKEYDKGLADTWEALRKVSKLKFEDQIDLFEDSMYEVICSKSQTEVIQKLKDWEEKGKEKEEKTFKAGDVIKQVCTSGSETGIVCVVKSYENGVLCGVTYEGNKVICSSCAERYWKKTGINFKDILMTEGKPE